MPQMNFTWTLDNSNVTAAVTDTTKKLVDLAETLEDLGVSTDATVEEATTALNKVREENEEFVDEMTQKLDELADKQRDAAEAGDADKVREIGKEMKETAIGIESVVRQTQKYGQVLETLKENPKVDRSLASVQEIDEVTKKMSEMAELVSELNSMGMDFTNKEQAVAALRGSLSETTQKIVEMKQSLDQLYEKQKEAVLAGDTEGVEMYGEKIAETATEMEKLTTDSQRLSDVLMLVKGSMDPSSLTGFAAEMAMAQSQIREAQLTLEALKAEDSSVDLSTTRGQISALRDAIGENNKKIKEYEATLKELEKEQEKAFSTGNFTGSEDIANQVLQVSDAIQRLRTENEQYAQVLQTVEDGVAGVNDKNREKIGLMTKLVGGQENYNEIMRLLPPELRKVMTGLNGITKASLKFIATPVGAVVAALVLAYKALSTWLNKSSEGQKKLAAITGYFQGVMTGLMNVVKKVGKALYETFTDPLGAVKKLGTSIKDHIIGRFKAVMNSFHLFAQAMVKLNRGEWKEAGQAFKDSWASLLDGSIAEKVGETIDGIHKIGKAESELNVKRDQLRRDRMEWMKEEGELDKQIAEQRNKLYVGSTSDRAKASAKMMDLINQKYDKQVEFAQREYEIKRDSNALSDSSLEDLEEEARLEKQVMEIEAQRESSKRMALRVEGMAERTGARSAEQARELQERREQLMETLAEASEEAERQANEVRISAMKDGFAKEQAELDNEHEERVAKIRENYQKQLNAIEKIQRAEWKAKHGGSTAGFSFNANDETAKEALRVATAQLENENKRYEIATENHLDNLVKQYQTYEEKEKEILRQGNEDIAKLEKEGYAEQAKLRRKAMEQELTDLRRQEKDIYKRIAQDTSKWGIVSIQKAIEDAQAELDEISSTPEKAIANADAIQNLQRAIESLKATARDFSLTGALKMLLKPDEGSSGKQTLAERWTAMRKAWKAMSTEDRWKNVGGWVTKISGGLGRAADYMKQIAELTGNDKLAESADKLDALARNFQAAGQGAAQGGWIGAVVGGVTDIISQAVEAFENMGAQEAIAAKNAKDWAWALETAFLSIDESKFASVFGEKGIGLAQENFKKAVQAIELYRSKLRELNEEYSNQNVDKYYKGHYGAYTQEYLTLYDALQKGYSGLQLMLVKTKDNSAFANWLGFVDEFKSLGDLAPELWDENGELVIENAQKFLSVNTQITDEQRKQIEQLIELRQGYEEAMKAVDDAISENFGSLSTDITDVIWDSVMNGSDAWEQFRKIGSEAISNLGKQMVQEMLISEYLEQYRDRMRAAYGLGSSEDTQRELRNITADIFSGMQGMLEAGSIVAEEYRKWAEQHGFDLSETGSVEAQNVKAGGFQTMSQDKASELNGRFSALQLSNELISQNARSGVELLLAISTGVASNTGILTEIRDFHMIEVGYLGDIAKYTKPLLTIGDKLDSIERNTSKL